MSDIEVGNRETVADWIETTVLARNSYIGLDALYAVLKQELAVSDASIALALALMVRRSELLGLAYPFDVSPFAVSPREGAADCIYSLLLLLSPDSPARQLIHRTPTDEMAVLFEKVVVRAMCGLLGSESRAIRFGWPSDEGRPQNFYQAIEWLSKKMGIEAGKTYRPPRRKDGGVDVVAWRPFRDGKSGFPVFLVQCTLQKEIESKVADIDIRNWAGWLTLDSDPGIVLAIPGTIASPQVWKDIAIRTLILDRIRIVGLLDNQPSQLLPGASKFIAALINSLTESLKGAER